MTFRSAWWDAAGAHRPLIMGVVNVTPDSCSDGDPDAAAAIAHADQLVRDGADIVDVGGEATNPRAKPTSVVEELDRVLPVIEGLRGRHMVISVDTTKAEVARAALAAGAKVVNDVSGGLFDPGMWDVAKSADAYIAGHLRGTTIAEVFAREAGPPPTWQEVVEELAARVAVMPPALRERTLVDPGIGFGKGSDPETNVNLLRHGRELQAATGRPVVVGPSRKRFLRSLLGNAPATEADLDAATVGACLLAAANGASVLRVHNVALLRPALIVYTEE